MPRSDSWGTFRMGRWGTIGHKTVWLSSADDPYDGLRFDQLPSWLLIDEVNAKEAVRRITNESGEDTPFVFGPGQFSSIVKRIEDARMAEKSDDDPAYFIEMFKKNAMYKRAYPLIAGAARSYHDSMPHICISPGCHYTSYYSDSNVEKRLARCRSCGNFNGAVRADVLIKDGVPPDEAIASLAGFPYRDLVERSAKSARFFDIALDNQGVALVLSDYKPALKLSRTLPQLRVGDQHFIRGRANRDVLQRNGIRMAREGDIFIQLFSSGADRLDIVERLLSDEQIILDTSVADKYRAEYIDTRWAAEFTKFCTALKNKDILLVHERGVSETLTSLYHMAQKRANVRTIIKRDGKIKFPTSRVLENISPFLLTRAFEITEHAAYDEVSQVFRIGEGEG
jgi:hypothetical protein